MNYLYIYLLLISIILFFSYYNSIHATAAGEEGFTPHIRRFYRPYVRKARMYTEGFYSTIQNHMNRILRKTGLRK